MPGKLDPARIGAPELAGEKVTARLTRAPGNDASIGGIKVTTENGWFAARPSGTEEVYMIYAESFLSDEHLKQIQHHAPAVVGNGIAWESRPILYPSVPLEAAARR